MFSFKEVEKERHWCYLDGIRKKVLNLYKNYEISAILFTCMKWGLILWRLRDLRSIESGSWTHVSVSRSPPPPDAAVSLPQEVHRFLFPRDVSESSVSIWITWDGRGFVLTYLSWSNASRLFSFVSGGPPEGRRSGRYSILGYLF